MQQDKPRFLGILAFSRPFYHIEATSEKKLSFFFSFRVGKEAQKEHHIIRRDVRCIRTRRTAAMLQDTGKML